MKTKTKKSKEWNSFLAHLKSDLDFAAFEQLVQQVPEQRRNKIKYLNVEEWMWRMWRQATELGLGREPPQSILDLGTGPGYFPYVCRYLGHDADALDRPGTQLYDEICAWVRIPVVPFAISAKVPFPALEKRYDLVTAFRVAFNHKGRQQLFDLEDWAYFLDDVRDNVLKSGGGLILKMIKQPDFEGLKFGDSKLMKLFASRGASFEAEKRYIYFLPLR